MQRIAILAVILFMEYAGQVEVSNTAYTDLSDMPFEIAGIPKGKKKDSFPIKL